MIFSLSSNLKADQPLPPYVPQKTVVAILPVIDATGGKDPNIKAVSNAQTSLKEQFSRSGFVIAQSADVNSAINHLKIDMTDEEQQKRDTLYKVGSGVKANLVVFVVVTNTDQREVEHLFSTSREGQAKIKIWLLDVNNQYAWLSAKSCEGKDKGRFYAEHSGSDLAARAVGNAVENGLKDFLKPYHATDVKGDKK